MSIPAITTEEMIEVDRLMIDHYGISLFQMMENAGSHLADLAMNLMTNSPHQKIVILCGGGNNGGGGMVAARHLHNRGMDVKTRLIAKSDHLKEVPLHQWEILQKIGLQSAEVEDFCNADLILDALIGYGITGNPHGEVAEWILKANQSEVPILSLDVPSGLNATTGHPGEPCIRATTTLTLALPKEGLLKETAKGFVGDLYLADISVPSELYRRLGLEIGPIFTLNTIVKL
jgi:NAD(P)H-hydrate epimerase